MKYLKPLASVVIVILALCSSRTSFASDTEMFYAGGSLAQVTPQNYCNSVSNTFTCDKTDATVSAFIGFQANRFFGIELGYADLGKYEIRGNGTGIYCNPTCSGTPGAYGYSDSLKTNGIKFSTIGSIPLGRGVFILGKLGLLHWMAKENSVISGVPSNTSRVFPTDGFPGSHHLESFNISDSGNAPLAGLGLKYEIGERLAVRFEFEMISRAYSKYDFNTYSSSLLYKF